MSVIPPTTIPTFIELDRDNRRLLVRWADEHESPLDWEYLRWRCPCAECSGEGGMPGKLQSLPMFNPGQSVMNDINLTGRYGVTPVWGDGHSLGIYTFPDAARDLPLRRVRRSSGRRGPAWPQSRRLVSAALAV